MGLRTAANLALLRTRLAGGSPATLLDPEGGWYAVLRVPATRSEDERVAGLLEHRNVLVHPGYFFDFPHEAFLVVSLLPTPQSFAGGVEREGAGFTNLAVERAGFGGTRDLLGRGEEGWARKDLPTSRESEPGRS